MKQKIIIPETISFDRFNNELANGAKFITYNYCISIFFAVTLKRMSPAYLILPHEPPTKYKRKYNLLTRVFGWWGIPWGIVYSIRFLKSNNSGGLDITNDIMLNLTEMAFKERLVLMKYVHDIFSRPIKSEKKEFIKSSTLIAQKANVESLFVGLFVNTDEYIEPHYVVGVSSAKDFDKCIVEVEKALYKRFRKSVPFEFIDLNVEDDYSLKLIEQGEKII